MKRKQTSIQVTEATLREAKELAALGFGSFTDVVRVAIDRMYVTEMRRSKLAQPAEQQ